MYYSLAYLLLLFLIFITFIYVSIMDEKYRRSIVNDPFDGRIPK